MKIVERFKAWRSYMATVNELNRLSNKELSDIGLTRCDIRRIARDSI